MIFLIEYDRNRGQLITFQKFEDSEREKAKNTRLQMELHLKHLGTEREVVLLEAFTEEALRRTHRRYFGRLSQLETSPA